MDPEPAPTLPCDRGSEAIRRRGGAGHAVPRAHEHDGATPRRIPSAAGKWPGKSGEILLESCNGNGGSHDPSKARRGVDGPYSDHMRAGPAGVGSCLALRSTTLPPSL